MFIAGSCHKVKKGCTGKALAKAPQCALVVTNQAGSHMAIDLSSDATKVAVASIQRYFSENMEESIGSLEAGALLSFFLKEIGPAVYNKAITDAQARLQERVAELDVEVYEEEFSYWTKARKGGR